MFPKVLLQWCAALSSCAAEIERRRQGKFQPFRRLFGKRNKEAAEWDFDTAELKASFSTGEVSNEVVSDDEETNQHLRKLNPIGSRALSYDSVFIPEEAVQEPSPEQTMSQENVSDKVRNLQRQIAQNIKFGQRPPSLRKSEGDEGSSDEEEVPRSHQSVLAQVEVEPVDTEPKGASQDQEASESHGAPQAEAPSTPVKSPRSKQLLPAIGTIESIDLDGVSQSVPRLDNTAAKHKLSVKPKKQRISRKHRRYTQDLQEVDIPGIQQEEKDAADSQHRTTEEETPPEKTKKQNLQEEERRESRRKRDLAEQRHRVEEEDRKKKVEEWRLHELEEERCRKQEEGRILKDEEERRQREEMERRMKEEEERSQREEMERRMKEEEERIQREEMERRMKEEEQRIQREEMERRMKEEERIQREEMERRMKEEEQRIQREEMERRMKEEEERIQREEERRMREKLELMQREEKERTLVEEKKKKEEEERSRKEEEERKQCELEAERLRVDEEKRLKEAEEEEERMKKHVKEKRKLLGEEEERKKKEKEEEKSLCAEAAASSSDPERKRRAEEVRWREMEKRQRPFTFKVSSGEKQILFQKVDLTPVILASSQQGSTVAEHRERAKASSPGGADSPTLPSSHHVPHTAILVTGGQLCGTAVNLDHIKEIACKSILGLADEKKAAMGIPPPTKTKTSPDRKSGKTKSLSESTDQSSAAVLAEWASIRCKIFKGAEEGKYEEYPDPQSQSRPSSEDQSPFPHTNLRKTMSTSAKFSITPARKKFANSNRNSEVLNLEEKEGGSPASALSNTSSSASIPPAVSTAPGSKAQSRGGKYVRISDGTGECMFAKDLPSFIVPSSSQCSHRPEGSETDAERLGGESEDSDGREEQGEKGQPSPFGIKLRRTNYSLRFHSDQSTDKRKKRYSAGDSFNGVPSPLTPIDPDASVFSDRSSPASPLRESIPGVKPGHMVVSLPEPWAKAGKSPTPSIHSEEKPSKPSLYQSPSTSPKPATPPPKVGRGGPNDAVVQRTRVGANSAGHEERVERTEETSAVAQLHRNGQGQGQWGKEEEEPKEKRSFFPSISIPWREQADRKTELIRKEGKPSLQSRHSLDSVPVQDKEAGPPWITLALQKQKGFREQQQSRDERCSNREAKLAEKQAKDKDSCVLVSPSEGKGSGNTSPPKPQTPEEAKRPDSLLGCFERRDHLKKANTLPSTVTVEIADSTPSPPAVKEVTKRFLSTDAPQVSTEPAWLALAKRKAKAWSECPQIIK